MSFKSFALLLPAFLISGNGIATTIQTALNDPSNVDLTGLNTNYRHQVSIIRAVTPKKMTGNPFRDSFLQARCGTQVLGTDSKRIVPSDFGKPLNFSLNFELSSEICDNFTLTVELQTNGITIESPSLELTTNQLGETADYFISHVRSDLISKQQDLVFYHGELSKASGSRQSLHCVIKTYEQDPSFDPITEDLKISYRKIFGLDYVAGDIDCTQPVNFSDEIASCSSTNPKRTFCAFYSLYSQALSWFKQSIDDAGTQKSRLRAGDETRSKALQELITEIESTQSASLDQISGK